MYQTRYLFFILISLIQIVITFFGAYASLFDALDDSFLHKISWQGPWDVFEKSINEGDLINESVVLTTAKKETYRCTLPKRLDISGDESNAYTGPNPFELLMPLFSQFVCTFKLETYWTYELCHGKYIRQYHEERDGKKVKLQEFYLGRWGKEEIELTRAKMEEDIKSPEFKASIPTKKIDGANMPYLQINMSDGTTCDLNGKSRNTRVLYICYRHGKHEIYSFEEVSTCEYEIIVLTPLLCTHPDFKSKETGEHPISCYSMETAPKMPKSLVELEGESLKIRRDNLLQNLESFLENNIKGDVKPTLGLPDEVDDISIKPLKSAFHDSSFLPGFLEGKTCLNGGSHWWKFEFCFGKHILQYHEEPDGARTEIFLGKWNEEKHIAFMDKNPHKKVLSVHKKNVIHYYSGGASCDKSGQPRTVEVRIKCVENPSPSAVAIYLLEPKVCEYSLGVESSLFCPLLKTADEYGKLDISSFITPQTSSSPIQGKSKDLPSNKIKRLKAGDEIDIVLMDEDEVQAEEGV